MPYRHIIRAGLHRTAARHDILISHRLPLEQAPEGYRNFHDNHNEWTKVVLKA